MKILNTFLLLIIFSAINLFSQISSSSFSAESLSKSGLTDRFGLDNIDNPMLAKKSSFNQVYMPDSISGPELKWLRSGETSAPDIISSLHLINSGNIIAGGFFSGKIKKDGFSKEAVGKKDGFVLNISKSGEIQWFHTFTGADFTESVQVEEVKVTSEDKIFVVGSFDRSFHFDTIHWEIGDQNLTKFILIFDRSGNLLSASQLDKEIHSFDYDSAGWVYMANKSTVFRFDSQLVRMDTVVSFNPVVFTLNHLDINKDKLYYAMGFGGTTAFYYDLNNIRIRKLEDDNAVEALLARSNLEGQIEMYSDVDHSNYYRDKSEGTYITSDDDGRIYMGGIYDNVIIYSEELDLSIKANHFIITCDSAGGSKSIVSEKSEAQDFCCLNDSLYVRTEGEISVYSRDLKDKRVIINSPVHSMSTSHPDSLFFSNSSSLRIINAYPKNPSSNDTISFDGNSGKSRIMAIEKARNGNLVIYGDLEDSQIFMDKRLEASEFVAEVSPEGQIVWLRQINNPDFFQQWARNAMTVDPKTGNIFLVLAYSPGMTYQGVLLDEEYQGIGEILLSLDPMGNILWTKLIKCDYIAGTSVVLDSNSDIYISMYLRKPATIDSITTTNDSGLNTIWLAKISTSGETRWIKRLGGRDGGSGPLIAVSSDNHLWLAGEFTGTFVMVEQDTVWMEEGDGNTVLYRINQAGEVVSATVTGSSTVKDYADWYSWPTGLINSSKDTCFFLKGWYGDSTYLGGHLLQNDYSPNARFSNYVAKFDKHGNCLWTQTIKKGEYSGFNDFTEMSVDDEGSLYLTMPSTDSLLIADSIEIIGNHPGSIILKFRSDGTFDWVKCIHNPNGSSFPSSVLAMDSLTFYVGGYFSGDFFLADEYLISSATNAFLTRFSKFSPFVNTTAFQEQESAVSIWPNPLVSGYSLNVLSHEEVIEQFEIIDISGKVLLTFHPGSHRFTTTCTLKSGLYLVGVRTRDQNYYTKKIIIR